MHEIPVVGPLWLNGVLCFVGFVYHVVMKWDEYRIAVEKVGFWAFVRDNPSKSAVSVASSALAFIGVWSLGWMNPGMAMGCGYMATSIIGQITKRNELAREARE